MNMVLIIHHPYITKLFSFPGNALNSLLQRPVFLPGKKHLPTLQPQNLQNMFSADHNRLISYFFNENKSICPLSCKLRTAALFYLNIQWIVEQ
jgi:hypothetical protein